MKKALALLLFAFSFCFAINFNEQINDEAHIFSQNERDELLNLVQNFEQNSTTQIAIVTLNSLKNKSIEELIGELRSRNTNTRRIQLMDRLKTRN